MTTTEQDVITAQLIDLQKQKDLNNSSNALRNTRIDKQITDLQVRLAVLNTQPAGE